MNAYLERVVDLLDPTAHQLQNMTLEEACQRLRQGPPEAVLEIEGSFALLVQEGRTVRMARSMDRPMRYFLAKRAEGPTLIVAERIDRIRDWLQSEGLAGQFHPSYTRMVPAHHVVELELIGCPDPAPAYRRFFTPTRNRLAANLDQIGQAYVGALADEIARWLQSLPPTEPIGVCFSGGIDSGAVFLTTYHVLRRLGLNPSRLKAFTLSFGDGPDLLQARQFLEPLGLGLFLESVEAGLDSLDVGETIRVVEDYKVLDIEAASMVLALCRGLRQRYPDWKHLVDGEGGDENLKDYPIEENPELTIRSVVNNLMLYQEGWGVGKFKHSLTYSGGLSRSYTRTYAPSRHYGFHSFSPFTRPRVIEVAEGIPFHELTALSVERLYALKGQILARGVKAVTGLDMPVFPKRRFQHGATALEQLRRRVPEGEAELRRRFLGLYA
jgi:asparagine synthase (glutamine-hydrolysing)